MGHDLESACPVCSCFSHLQLLLHGSSLRGESSEELKGGGHVPIQHLALGFCIPPAPLLCVLLRSEASLELTQVLLGMGFPSWTSLLWESEYILLGGMSLPGQNGEEVFCLSLVNLTRHSALKMFHFRVHSKIKKFQMGLNM